MEKGAVIEHILCSTIFEPFKDDSEDVTTLRSQVDKVVGTWGRWVMDADIMLAKKLFDGE